MANNISMKDASGNTVILHTIEDSTSAHFTQSIPITASGGLLFDQIPGAVSISPTQGNIPVSVAGGSLTATIADNAPVSVRGGRVSIADSTLAVTQSGTWNTNASVVGRVSVFVDQIPFNVSINNTLPVPVSIVGGTLAIADNAPVSVRGGRVSIADSTLAVTQSGTWNTNASVVGRVSVFVDQVPFNVSINNSLPVPVSVVGGKVSIADSTLAVTQSGTWNTNASVVGRVSVFIDQIPFNVSINNSLPVPVSVVGGRVSIADSTLAVTQSGTWNTNASVVGRVSVFVDQVPFNVSINNTLPVPVSIVGGRVSIQGISQVSIAGLVTVDAKSNTGAAVPAGAFYVGGTDGTNLRGLKTHTDGSVLVHVCNSQPAASGITQLVSVGGAVSTQIVQIGGTDGTDARTLALDDTGYTRITQKIQTTEYSFTRPADTAAYSSGELVGNSTTSGSVVPLSFKVSRKAGGGGELYIRRGKMVTSWNSGTTGAYRLHLFNQATGCSTGAGDNTILTGSLALSPVSAYLGYVDFVATAGPRQEFLRPTQAATSTTTFVATIGAGIGTEIAIVLASTQSSISGFIEARGASTPTNAGTVWVQLEIWNQ